MEAWLSNGVYALAGVLLGGLFSYLGIKAQIKHSDKRFEKEFERAREVDFRKRRWEVRGEPLLRLRSELARMATKADRLAKAGHGFDVSNTREQNKEALKEAVDDWHTYTRGDDFQQVLSTQADTELVKLVKDIRNQYLNTYDAVVTYREGKTAIELGEAARASEEVIAPKVAQAQEFINKKLEEL